jgi:glycosyltransferase involved in cell wall biosynthesis
LFERNTSKKNAREKIGLEISENVFLCFGKLRDKEELDFLRSGFSRSSVPRKRLVIAGRLPARSRKSPKHYVFRIPLWLDSKISIYERFIPPANVNYYVRSSDVVIIPRLHALNSGNVALGLTFGKIVVGTETGVIGEMLQNLGNPTFDPSAPDTLSNALERAADMIGGPITKKNRSYARENLDWSRIAEKHYQFYRQVRK